MEHAISTTRLANSNEGHIHFIISGARKRILFVIRMKILMLIQWPYRFPELCWLYIYIPYVFSVGGFLVYSVDQSISTII
jgi:hypothetical protein